MSFFDDFGSQVSKTVSNVTSDFGTYLSGQIQQALVKPGPVPQPSSPAPAPTAASMISAPVASVGGVTLSVGMLAALGVGAILLLRRR